ncbi:MAG TPA: sigma-54 dependent transcriptional regulator [Anaeromyxobacter sp.]|nr:sigma-54 dependent transcriptional regulator [Anaeromyxobacter sp.]
MGKASRILVVDDDPASRDLLRRVLATEGHQVVTAGDGREALAEMGRQPAELVVSDIRMPELDGVQLLERLREAAPEVPVILVTAFGDVEGAVDAIRRGAFDYLAKPYDVDAVRHLVRRALAQAALASENRELRKQVRDKYRLEGIVGRSEPMLRVFKTAARVAQSDATVLIEGESGTGKEQVARAIHAASRRASLPFVAVDCGAIAEGVLESELFGHAKGAFTGAQGSRRGLFEEANHGTLFLDEMGDVGPALQARLLRALQEGEIRRVGANEAVPVDVRVLAATNKDLARQVKEGKFREDLYYRVNVVTIHLPPLRERREDIPLLAEHFAAKHGRPEGSAITPEARELLVAYDWPGNVRELENVIARALALNHAGLVVPEDLPDRLRGLPPAIPPPGSGERPTLAEVERRYAAQVLAEAGGNKTRAAEILGIDRKTLYRILGEEKEDGHG